MQNFDSFISDLSTLISFKSVESPAKENMPFGEGVNNALNYFLNLAREFGFSVKNYDNYMGEITFGNGPELGIIGHLDVVPEGDGWETEPFTLTYKDGYYYARGILDDKAPLLMCLYILKELKDSNVEVNRTFKLYVGCDEESGWKDVDYFLTKSKFTKYGFSPDGDFPVSYAEKGLNKITFKIPKLKNFYNLKGGTVFNAVCGYASVSATPDGINQELLNKYNLKLTGDVIESFGKSVHGSRPQYGINAFKGLFEYFTEMGEDTANVLDYLFSDKGNVFGIKDITGNATISPDIIWEEKDYIYILCDFRIPSTMRLEGLLNVFDSFGIEYTAEKIRDPLYVEKDSEFVQTLVNSFNKATNSTLEPVSMSGGTFASVFEKGCSFGPEFPDEVSTIHEANERASKEQLLKMYDIYKLAIFEFANKK